MRGQWRCFRSIGPSSKQLPSSTLYNGSLLLCHRILEPKSWTQVVTGGFFTEYLLYNEDWIKKTMF